MRDYRQKMVEHLKTQMAQGLNTLDRCCYRGAGGLKCAVGALIPDDQYHWTMDSEYSLQQVIDACGALLALEAENRQFFDELNDWRDYHDNAFNDYDDGFRRTISYGRWLETRDDVDSPEAMLEAIVRKYGE